MIPKLFSFFRISGNRIYFSTISKKDIKITLRDLDKNLLYSESMNLNPNVTYYFQHPKIKHNEFILCLDDEEYMIRRYFDEIKQIFISPVLTYFLEGLKHRWNLFDYYDMDAPCLFFGCFSNQSNIDNHNGYKILIFASHTDPNWFESIQKYENLIVSHHSKFSPPPNVKTKFLSEQGIGFEIKDYSDYTPTQLGNKIYCYYGSEDRKGEFHIPMVESISKKIPFEIIYGFVKENELIKSKEEMINIYQDCFLNINFNLGKGLTTVAEMAFMGIKTLANNKRHLTKHWDCMIDCDVTDETQIISLIMEESKKIGFIQKSINIHEVGDEWQKLNFWL